MLARTTTTTTSMLLRRSLVAAPATTAPVVARLFRTTAPAGDVFKDKEMGEENIYFRKEDELLMQKLLKKMKDKELQELIKLKALLKPHELPDDVLQAIVDWKHHD